MKLLVLFGIIGLSTASVIPLGVTVGVHPNSHPIQSLYHAQDVLGQYTYGYATPTSTKSEIKTADGITQGGYSYIDSNGILQTVQYIADPKHGFRVAASNLPQDSLDVALEKADHHARFEAIKAEHAAIAAQAAVAYSNPIAVPVSAVPQIPLVPLPQPVQDLPEVVKARALHLAALQAAYSNPQVIPQIVQDLPEVVQARAEHLATVEATKAQHVFLQNSVNLSPIPEQLIGDVVQVPTKALIHAPISVAHATPYAYSPVVSNQYHSQDNWGQYSYGYVEPLSSKVESRTADGVTRGGYSYLDANGIIQTVQYIADAQHGFRVAATNLPVGPS